MRAILLNGPPRAGKDSASLAIEDYFDNSTLWCEHEKFSRPIKTAFVGMMGVEINEDFVVEHYEANKERTIPELGVSFRKWQQDYSEKFMKPLYGQDVFSRLLLGRLARSVLADVVVISDCGFQIEVDTLLNAPMIGQVLLLQVHRHGCSFEGDTREWVKPHGKMDHINLQNDGTLEEFQTKVRMAVKEWLR